MAASAIAEGAKDRGAILHQNCAVRGLDIANGRVQGVFTERGPIRASSVVAAGGAWNSRFLPPSRHSSSDRKHWRHCPSDRTGPEYFNRRQPLRAWVGDSAASRRGLHDCGAGVWKRSISHHRACGMRRNSIKCTGQKLSKKLKYRLNSSFWNGPEAWGSWHDDQISPFEKIRVLDPAPDPEIVETALRNLRNEFPALRNIKVAACLGADRLTHHPISCPSFPRLTRLHGLVIASGFSGHGFGIGPGAGRFASELVMNETPFVEPAPFRLSRFSGRFGNSAARYDVNKNGCWSITGTGPPARRSRSKHSCNACWPPSPERPSPYQCPTAESRRSG